MSALDEIKRRYPFIETHDLKGALYDPSDGDIDPAQLTQALAKGARDMGAKIIRFCPVTGVRRENDEWVVETPQGEIRCEIVVNAAGYRAAEVGKMFGRDVPMMVMSHQYILFEEIPELAAWSKEQGKKLPLLRDVDTSYYLRQEKNGMNLGPYERNCRAHWATHNDPMPEDFSFQLFPDDLDRLEHYLADAVARVPILGTAGLSKVINGPIPYAPDGNPLIGPMPGVPNAFEACVFTFGIAQGGGAGKVLAEWVTQGQTEWDMWSCDPRRFTSFAAAPDYCVAKGMEIYGNEYAIQFPRHAWPAGRDRKLSPIHDRIKALGARFDAYNGWERATWYAQARRRHFGRSHTDLPPRWAVAASRARRMPGGARRRRHSRPAGLLALSTSKAGRRRMAGDACHRPGAEARPHRPRLFLRRQGPHRHRNVGRAPRRGSDYSLITAAVAQWHDFEWLKIAHAAGRSIQADRPSPRNSPLPDPVPARTRGKSSPMSATPTSRCPGSRIRKRRSPAAGPSWCASPSPANSAGKSTPRSTTPPPSSTPSGPPDKSTA